LTCRASSITCCPSRTSTPWPWSSKSIGISAKSTPTGMPATPAAASVSLISATPRLTSRASGGAAPRIVVYEAMQCSGFSHGQYIRWCTAADPKSHRKSSPVRV
jgi:hypothetical protein